MRRASCAAIVAIAALPAAASAGTIWSEPETSTLTFLAAPGERNDVTYNTEAGSGLFMDAGARLIAGDNCTLGDAGASCRGGYLTVVRLGDRDDRAHIDTSQPDVDGGEGDDVLYVGAGTRLRASGGPGDDRIDVSPNGSGYVYGDDGDDRLSGGEVGSRLWGGKGDDTLRGVGVYPTLDGGPGADRLIATAGSADAAFAGGDGDDVIYDRTGTMLGETIFIAGGSGDDVIYGGAEPGEVVDAGPGDDRVHAWSGLHDAIICGPGIDVAYADLLDSAAGDCETVRMAPRGALAALARRLAERRPGLPGARALRLLDQALAQVRAAGAEACYESERLRADTPCLVPLVAAVRRLAQVPALASETRELVGIERDLALARADEAAGLGAPARRLERAREDIAAAAGLPPVEASLRLQRVWQWLTDV